MSRLFQYTIKTVVLLFALYGAIALASGEDEGASFTREVPVIRRLGSGRARRSATETVAGGLGYVEDFIGKLREQFGEDNRAKIDDFGQKIKGGADSGNIKLLVASAPIIFLLYKRTGGWIAPLIGGTAFVAAANPNNINIQSTAATCFAVWVFKGFTPISLIGVGAALLAYVGFL